MQVFDFTGLKKGKVLGNAKCDGAGYCLGYIMTAAQKNRKPWEEDVFSSEFEDGFRRGMEKAFSNKPKNEADRLQRLAGMLIEYSEVK